MKKLLVILVLGILLINFTLAISITGSTAKNKIENESDVKDNLTKINDDLTNEKFCGTSTEDNCATDSDCYNGGCGLCMNKTNKITKPCTTKKCHSTEEFSKKCSCQENKCKWITKFVKSENMTKEEFKELIREKTDERKIFKFEEKTGQECVDGCVCEGVVMKCKLEDGSREMTVYTKSGNIIFQVKNVNASTKVTIYHHNQTLYAELPDGTIKEVKIMPDKVLEKIKEKIKSKVENENITLNKGGFYEVHLQKKSKLFFLFPVREKVHANVDAENGNLKIRNPWWGFLAKDIEEKPLLGESCGTVTPGTNDECCKNKGYNSWNVEKQECI